MSERPTGPVTQLLEAVGRGEADAQEKLWAVIYDDLHRVAQCQMADEAPGRTLQATALVHEAYLRLVGDGDRQWVNRKHFFAAAARAMRRIRIDDARRRKSLKRGGGDRARPLQHDPAQDGQNLDELLAVDEALAGLEKSDPRKAEIVMLRYFAGLSGDEIAEALGLSPRTVDSEWRFARVWLHRELAKGDSSVI